MLARIDILKNDALSDCEHVTGLVQMQKPMMGVSDKEIRKGGAVAAPQRCGHSIEWSDQQGYEAIRRARIEES